MTLTLPVADPRTVEAYARELVAKPGSSRVLALAADPDYRGPGAVDVDGVNVQVRGCVSSLAVREALVDLPGDGYAIVLTDRSIEDLGDSLVARFRRQRIEPLDAWATVPGLFRAKHVDSGLRHSMPWLPEALFTWLPAQGYPPSATELVTRDDALGALTGEILGIPPEQVGLTALLDRLGEVPVRSDWARLPDPARDAIVAWVSHRAGPAAGAALTLAAAPSTGHVHLLALGLMLDVLYADPAAEVVEARRGWENGYRLPRIDPAAAAQIGAAARGRMRLLGDTEPAARRDVWRDTPEAFAIAAFPSGITRSLSHPDGYRARLSALATAVEAALQGMLVVAAPGRPAGSTADVAGPAGGTAAALQDAVAALRAHDLAWTDQQTETERADMAARLVRWLSTAPAPGPATLRLALARQAATDGWVDRALADVWSGSTHAVAAEAYRALCARVVAARREHDRQFAALLAEACRREALDPGLLPVERVLAEVIDPLSGVAPVLLVVIDGMSTGVAVAVSEGISRLAWTEHVPAVGGGVPAAGAGSRARESGSPASGAGAQAAGCRAAVLAALPTLTRYSRTSLLCGTLREGAQADEKREFAALTRGRVFHKDDLRAPAGSAVNQDVAGAIASADRADRVVAVVLNTVDDTLAKHDPDGTRWSVSAIQHLEPLLELARQHGRIAVLISDHGHVVERGGRADLRELADARWRPTSTGLAGDGEVLLAGPRVLASGGSIIAAWHEDLRYGRKAAGYHGGASAAEVTIPLLVFAGPDVDLRGVGWVPAEDQTPTWWEHPVDASVPASRPPVSPPLGAKPARSRHRPAAAPAPGPALFDLPEPAGPASGGAAPAGPGAPALDPHSPAIAAFAASRTYQRMRQSAGRGALADVAVRGVLSHLLAGEGRAPVDQIARAVGVPVARIPMAMSNLRRLLNVEGYPVISMDPDGRTVLLDIPLWRQQFEVDR